LRRRNALFCAAIASAIAGAFFGSGAGGGHEPTEPAGHVKLARGGLGPPSGNGELVHWTKPVPILMYHVISNPPPSAQLPELYVPPRTFDREMEWLKSRGYQGVSLNQVDDAWFKHGELPRRPVVVSFDDGYRGQYVYARPELQRLGWPGVLNLVLRNLDEPDAELTPAMVEQLIHDGWELDSHTVSHLDVTELSGGRLNREVGGSRRILQSRFHQPVNFFCYPAGHFDADAIRAVRAAGYLGATTEIEGLGSRHQMFTLKRIRVDGSDGVRGLERKLSQAGA
jgi:peptidoglycan/xylan/chitin deacetylase (PgdA/CDA1 family)